ncbi:hypothetical protein ACIRYZ_08725 [Kitasatospora sp. NPDC101155]|uniref:acyl-CoA-like ligand-binding transcription factor n=1 Tax=Kitasatospora sp. NPDC101155 TaxID=3364097 RepID=UPI0037F5D683
MKPASPRGEARRQGCQAWRSSPTGEVFAAERLRRPVDALTPQVIAHTALGASLAAYDHWLRDEDSDLEQILDQALRRLTTGFHT